jgi:hypothetical protein
LFISSQNSSLPEAKLNKGGCDWAELNWIANDKLEQLGKFFLDALSMP